MTESERVRVEMRSSLAVVTLARPDKHNAMDFRMLNAVRKTARSLRRERSLRAVVIHGMGPSFCAGLDVKSVFGDRTALARGYLALWSPVRNRFQDWSMAWRELPVPVIAAVHGNCFGAGLQLALGADIRIATADARLSVMEAKWGLVPDMGGTVLMRELIAIDIAKELTMTGRILTGADAHGLGLVTHLDADPLGHAFRLAAELATRSPDSVAASKFLLQEAWSAGPRAALASERKWQRRILGRANQRIAIRRNAGPARPDAAEAPPFGPRRLR